MADITQNIDPVGQYGGTIPDRATQSAEEFANNVYPFQLYWNSTFVPNTVTMSQQITAWNTQANDLKDEVNSIRLEVVEKEAAISPHYTAIDNVNENIGDINSTVANMIDIQNASSNAAIATQKAQEAADTVANIEDDRIMVETKAAEVASNTDTVLATASIDFASFTLEDGELNIGYFDPTASTPSIIDGEFIITY